MKKSKITYSSAGVDYNVMDPLKKLAQKKGSETSKNLLNFSFQEKTESRGESAFVWEEENSFRAFVMEGLGTKNLVADEVRKITGKTHYDQIAQDTVAMIVNDLIVVGARPQVINAYFATGSTGWFEDRQRATDLIEGWAKACNLAGATWGGGETTTLTNIIKPGTIDLAGSAIGEISPKQRLTLGEKLQDGDSILLIESSGIHSNGLTLARKIAKDLPDGYAAKLSDGKTFGETLLIPTYIYMNLVKDLFEDDLDIHYMVNITGHGWRKLMRANQDFSYIISQTPPLMPIFDFIQKNSESTEEDMYSNFNMGAGFAIYLPANQTEKAQEIAQKNNLKSWKAGTVQKGAKQVMIKDKNITFESESLNVR